MRNNILGIHSTFAEMIPEACEVFKRQAVECDLPLTMYFHRKLTIGCGMV